MRSAQKVAVSVTFEPDAPKAGTSVALERIRRALAARSPADPGDAEELARLEYALGLRAAEPTDRGCVLAAFTVNRGPGNAPPTSPPGAGTRSAWAVRSSP